ncbi:MAG: Ribonuclease R [Firmicutes bacterium ADurb.Bin193]|nr:MAG: Ribonuclease R [Firmicutes bacterium ADurb.Bin193]
MIERSRTFTEFKELLRQHGLTQEFPLAVMDEVSKIPEQIPEEEFARRRDLSDMTIVTIDGEDAKDLDDAISVERLSDGNYLLGVHIADVSWYVRANTELDDEAFNRGTSVYLVDKVVPMLPKKLSNGLCSLNPHKPRLTVSCFMTIDESGGVIDYELCESFIVSKARMTYTKVTKVLDGDMAARSEFSDLVPTFELMRELALILRDKRMRRGSIDFDFPEPKIITDDDGRAVDVKLYENTVSNKIIEEFMLAANETVARHMSSLELPLVYRVHEKPTEDKIERFVNLVRSMNYRFKMKKSISPKAMQNLLFQIEGKPEQLMLSTMMLRSFMKARYSNENLGHFGLAADYYCHFTSPIRRYPDLMVHRILREWLNGRLDKKRIALYAKLTKDAAEQSSDTEVGAVEAERDWVSYKMCEYMEDKVGQDFDGIISSVTSFGIFIQLPNTIEGLIRMSDLNDDYYEFDEATMTLVGRHTRRTYRIGESIRVRLARVAKDVKQIDFVPVEAFNEKKPLRKKQRAEDDKDSEAAHKEVKRKNGRKSKQKTRTRSGHKARGAKQKGKA